MDCLWSGRRQRKGNKTERRLWVKFVSTGIHVPVHHGCFFVCNSSRCFTPGNCATLFTDARQVFFTIRLCILPWSLRGFLQMKVCYTASHCCFLQQTYRPNCLLGPYIHCLTTLKHLYIYYSNVWSFPLIQITLLAKNGSPMFQLVAINLFSFIQTHLVLRTDFNLVYYFLKNQNVLG